MKKHLLCSIDLSCLGIKQMNVSGMEMSTNEDFITYFDLYGSETEKLRR